MKNYSDGMKKVMKGAGLVMAGIMVSKVLGYIYRVIVARTGTEPYGLLSMGLALFGILVTFSLLGLDTGVLRYVSYYKSKNDPSKIKSTLISTLRISMPLSVFFAILSFVLSGWLANNFFHNPQLETIFKIISVSVPFDVLGIILFQFNKAFHIVKYEVFIKYIGENVVKIIALIALLFLGVELLGPTIAYTIGIIFSGILAFMTTSKKVFPFMSKEIEYIPVYKKILSFSWPLILTHFLIMISSWVDTIMIGYFRNASEVGVYNAAIPTAQVLYVIPYAISFLTIPVLTGLFAKKDWKSFNKIYSTTTKWIFTFELFVFTAFAFLSSHIMTTLFGLDYSAASTPFLILSIGYFLNYIAIISSNILVVFKKTKWIFIDLVFGTLLNVILNYILIPLYGINGAAIATSLSFGLLGVAYMIQASRLVSHYPLGRRNVKPVLAIIIASTVMLLFSKWIQGIVSFQKTIYLLISELAVLFIVYGLLLIAFKVFKHEKEEFLPLIRNKFMKMIK